MNENNQIIFERLLKRFEEIKNDFVNDANQSSSSDKIALDLLDEVLSNLRQKQESHPDLLAYVRRLLKDILKNRNADLLEKFENYFDSTKIFISSQYLNPESQQTNAVGVLIFIDSNEDKPFTVLFNYQNEITTLGVRVIKGDKCNSEDSKRKILEKAIKRRLKELGFFDEDVVSITKIDRNQYGYQEASTNYDTNHHIVIIKSQPKEEIRKKIDNDNSQLVWIKQFKKGCFIVPLEDFVEKTQLSKVNNEDPFVFREAKIKALYHGQPVRLSTILMLRLAKKNRLYYLHKKSLPNDMEGSTHEQIAELCEIGKHFTSIDAAAIASWYQSDEIKHGDSLQANITLLNFLDTCVSDDLPKLNPALIKELVFRLFEPDQSESNYFHENLAHWFTAKSRLVLQTVTGFFLLYSSASNDLSREYLRHLIQNIYNEVNRELNNDFIEQFYFQCQNDEHYRFLKDYVATILDPKLSRIENFPKRNLFYDHLGEQSKAYISMIKNFSQKRFDSLNHFGFFYYFPGNFVTVVTNILWGRMLTETFQKFISPVVERHVKKALTNNGVLDGVGWKENMTSAVKIKIISGPIASGKSSLMKKIKAFIKEHQPIASLPDELILVFSSMTSNPLIRAGEFLSESWFVKEFLFQLIKEKVASGLYASMLIETINPAQLPLDLLLKISTSIEILWNFSSPEGAIVRMIERGKKENRFVSPSVTISTYKSVYMNFISLLKKISDLQKTDVFGSKHEISIKLYNTDVTYQYGQNKATDKFIAAKEKVLEAKASKQKIVVEVLNLPAFMMLLHYHYAITNNYQGPKKYWEEEFADKSSIKQLMNAFDKLISTECEIHFQGKAGAEAKECLKSEIISYHKKIIVLQKQAFRNRKSNLSTPFFARGGNRQAELTEAEKIQQYYLALQGLQDLNSEESWKLLPDRSNISGS